jgi:cell division septation protein DedD
MVRPVSQPVSTEQAERVSKHQQAQKEAAQKTTAKPRPAPPPAAEDSVNLSRTGRAYHGEDLK